MFTDVIFVLFRETTHTVERVTISDEAKIQNTICQILCKQFDIFTVHFNAITYYRTVYYFLAIPLVAYVAKVILFWPAGWTNHLQVDILAPADFAFQYFAEHGDELELKYYHLKYELSHLFS